MSQPCDDLDAFYDGELPSERRAAFTDHLVGCARCQAALEQRVQLDVATATWGTGAPAQAAVIPLRPRRRAIARLAAGGGVLAAAAAIALVLRTPDPTDPIDGEQTSETTIELPPTRTLEARLGYAPTDHHRPYAVDRAGPGTNTPVVPLATMGRLEQAGDFHGLAAMYLLGGELERAEAALQRAGDSPAVRSDRAALLLARGDLSPALATVDAALAEAPDLRPALWNRGLILRGLGLPRAAAAVFDELAAAAEPGWSDEARALAEALRRGPAQREQVFTEIREPGRALVRDGTPLPAALVTAAPGLARLYLYDAVRAAPDAARVLALRPLAEQLDAIAGGEVLRGLVDRTAASDLARRREHAATYAALATGERTLEAAEADAYLRALERAGFTDLYLGAIAHTGQLERRLDEFTKLAEATGDPWFVLLAAHTRGKQQLAAGSYFAAEATLRGALDLCRTAAIDYRCARVESTLADLYIELLWLAEADAMIDSATRRVEVDAQWDIETTLLYQRASTARLRSDLPRLRAVFAEAALRLPAADPYRCEAENFIHTSLADVEVLVRDNEAGRAHLDRIRDCGEPPSWLALYTRAELARQQRSPADAQRVRDGLAALASQPPSPGSAAVAAFLAGRVELMTDRARGQALLREAIAQAEPLGRDHPFGPKIRAFSHADLVMDAGEFDGGVAALRLIAGEIGIETPERCALGLAVDHTRTLVVGIDAKGAPLARLTPRATGLLELDARTLVPADFIAHLRECAAIDVLARPPIAGLPGLLPAELAWSYRVGQGHLRERLPPRPAPTQRLVVADVEPPPTLGLPALAPWRDVAAAPGEQVTSLTGKQATRERVLAALPRAGVIEIHAHGLVNLGISDASLIVLAADAAGRYALTAADIRKAQLPAAPLVILGACHAGQVAPYLHEPWSLAMAFVEAGASAVIASPEPLPDRSAAAFIAAIRTRVRAGESAAVAVRDERLALPTAERSWADDVLVFR